MNDKWYYFAGGVLLSAAIFSFLSVLSPQGELFFSIPASGLIVKESIHEDIRVSGENDVRLIGYYEPFDGKNNLPEKVVYKGRECDLRIVSRDDLSSSDLEIKYLFSIGESGHGNFPVYAVKSGFCESLVVLDEPFYGDPLRK